MKNGFYPALGTPTDGDGKLIRKSYERGINLMIEAGAQGVLCLGSMGKMETIRNSEYPVIAKECCSIVARRIPVMVGVMDCSVARVLDRIDSLGKLDIAGVVATAPFYGKVNEKHIINFFSLLAKNSPYPVYIYDLPSVTQSSVTENALNSLIKLPNIKGIKTANFALISKLERIPAMREDFSVFYSGLDLFDVAMRSGIMKNLDGMFTCTPNNSKKMYSESVIKNDDISIYLKNILVLRDLFLKEDLMQAYSYAMGLLDCQGNYHADYCNPISEKAKEEIRNCMQEIGEL